MLRHFKLLIITLLSTSFLFGDCAEDPCNACGCYECCCPQDCCSTCGCNDCCCKPCDFCPPERPEIAAYNAPKFYDIKCGWNVFLTASFVYAEAKQQNMQTIQTNSSIYYQNFDFSSFSKMSNEYKPAFKVGLGFNWGCDNWNFYAEYFRYHADAGKGSFTKNAPEPLNGAMSACFYLSPFRASLDSIAPTSVSATTTWRLDMDRVDFNLRRKYFVGECLIVQPSIGLSAAWIDQKQDTIYVCNFVNGSTTTLVNNSSDSWAVGAKTALDTEWTFCRSFRIIGNAGFAILYTDYNKIKSNATQSTTTTVATETYNSSRSLCFLRPDANVAIGLGWGDYWCCNDWYFDLSAVYEFHTYYNQNVLPNLKDCSQDPSSFNGDLYLHGLILTARLDF